MRRPVSSCGSCQQFRGAVACIFSTRINANSLHRCSTAGCRLVAAALAFPAWNILFHFFSSAAAAATTTAIAIAWKMPIPAQ